MATRKHTKATSRRKLPPGMSVRGRTYYARFMHSGRLIRKRLSSDYRVACELLNDLKAKADRGDFGIIGNDCPWSDIKAEFLRWAKQQISNPQDYARDLKRFEECCHPRNVRDVTPAAVHAFREWRLDHGKTARTVNREVGTIVEHAQQGRGVGADRSQRNQERQAVAPRRAGEGAAIPVGR